MPTPFPQDDLLQRLMAQAHIPSYRALSQRAAVSRSSINQLRRGQLATMRLETLQRLSQALGIELGDLVARWNAATASANPPAVGPSAGTGSRSVESEALGGTADGAAPQGHAVTVETLHQEYARLQQRLATQEQDLRRQVQQQALRVIEPWLLMWPNAAQAAQQKASLPASKLIPLARPWQELLQTWAVCPIGTLGDVVAYDPKIHQIYQATGALVQPGQAVQVRHLGYWHGEDLLHRAQVIPVAPPTD
ncbi:hypothetical protein GFS31_12350 [Leptolyngbya sp. BL0902]|uniref:helix-turn-helix domain-containing protein n=1 Tax=Leptolyngbya sp. BL0902 TaxID=1115757 RepID=UPI0018E78526|nr:helix-turn-helix transcriptional regulator [Leptolyngbya sp. BL0902]QQE64554.1 hypothetical protein GFS31_12350 [Leptolyngbya sp. BL0902]